MRDAQERVGVVLAAQAHLVITPVFYFGR